MQNGRGEPSREQRITHAKAISSNNIKFKNTKYALKTQEKANVVKYSSFVGNDSDAHRKTLHDGFMYSSFLKHKQIDLNRRNQLVSQKIPYMVVQPTTFAKILPVCLVTLPASMSLFTSRGNKAVSDSELHDYPRQLHELGYKYRNCTRCRYSLHA